MRIILKLGSNYFLLPKEVAYQVRLDLGDFAAILGDAKPVSEAGYPNYTHKTIAVRNKERISLIVVSDSQVEESSKPEDPSE